MRCGYSYGCKRRLSINFLLIQSAGEHPENEEFREALCLARGLDILGHWATVGATGYALHYLDRFDAIVILEQYPDKCDWLPDLARVDMPKLLWAIDPHCRGWEPYCKEYHRGRYTKLLCATMAAPVDWDTIWFPNAYDDTLIGPRDVGRKWNVGFVGNEGSAERMDWIKRLQVDVWLRDATLLGEKMVRYINQSKIHWNMNIADDVNYRNFETIGCGVPLVTNSRGPAHDEQYDRLGFKSGTNCYIYRDYQHCVSLIKDLRRSPELREQMGIAGLELAARHTYKARAKQLVEIVEGL